jgi:hypothetical protein
VRGHGKVRGKKIQKFGILDKKLVTIVISLTIDANLLLLRVVF